MFVVKGLFVIKRRKRVLILFCIVLLVAFLLSYKDLSRTVFGHRKIKPTVSFYKKMTSQKLSDPTTVYTTSNPTVNTSEIQFKLVLPIFEPVLKPTDKELYLAVIVNSGANGEKHRTLRDTIRKTWGNTSEVYTNTEPLKWKLFFAFGLALTVGDYKAEFKEAVDYNDIIIGNFSENYKNVVIKTFMGLFWATTKLSYQFVLKTDDDVYVRVPHLMTWLEKTGSPRSFYGGYISKFDLIPRDPKSPWFISFKQYAKKNWPQWCHGAYTVFSSDVIPRYLIYTVRRKPFHTDDAYFGVASEDLHIKAVHIPGFEIEHDHPERVRSDKELNRTLTHGHQVTPKQMLGFHKYYKTIYGI